MAVKKNSWTMSTLPFRVITVWVSVEVLISHDEGSWLEAG